MTPVNSYQFKIKPRYVGYEYTDDNALIDIKLTNLCYQATLTIPIAIFGPTATEPVIIDYYLYSDEQTILFDDQ